MLEIIESLLFPALIVVGWFLSSRYNKKTCKVARILSWISVFVFLCIVAGGILSDGDSPIHKWGAHGLVLYLWLAIPFALGVALQRQIKTRPVVAVVKAFVLLAIIGMVILASFTGYLTPDVAKPIAEQAVADETQNRFIVLHCFVMPTAVGVLLATWAWMFRASSE